MARYRSDDRVTEPAMAETMSTKPAMTQALTREATVAVIGAGTMGAGIAVSRFDDVARLPVLRVAKVIHPMAAHYGEDRFRVCPLVARRAATGGKLDG